MEANMAGDDASLDAAVAIIAKKISPGDVGVSAKPDAREDRADRDPIEADDYHDLHDLEALERDEARAKAGEEPTKGDEKGEESQEADAKDDAFIELPTTEEGKAPERVPLAEAVEAVQKLRQMNGDIDTAVIRAEEEAYQKQDQITQALSRTFSTIEQQARVALQLMDQYLPQAPDPIMLDRNSGYWNPEQYHSAKLYYDSFMQHRAQVEATVRQAQQGRHATDTQQDTEMMRRENERASRYIPEFKDEKSREAKKAELLEVLGPRYGLDKQALEDIADHRGWRILNDLAKTMKAERAAPEVRKSIQDKAPKLVQGRLPERDKSNGRFVSEARKAHKESGSEESLARLLLSSGALNGL